MNCFLWIHICRLRKINMTVSYFCNQLLAPKHLQNKPRNMDLPSKYTAARFFSGKDLIRSERDRWEKSAAYFMNKAAYFQQRLSQIYERYADNLDAPVIIIGDSAYFEEDGYIFRSRPSAEHVETIVDLQALGFSSGQIQRIRISPDQERLAASVTSTCREEATCIIVNLQKLGQVEQIIPNVFSFEWANNDVLFYTEQKNVRSSAVFLCDVSDGNYTKQVYTENNPRFFVDLCCTKDKNFLTINSNSKTSSEVWLLDRDRPFDQPFLIQQRTAGVIYHIEHRNDTLYILTTLGENSEYKLMKAQVGSCTLENWQLIYTVKEKTRLVDMEMMKDHCVMFLKCCNYLHFTVISLVTETVVLSTPLPAWACAFESENPCESSSGRSLRFQLSSPVQSPVRFVYSLEENNLFVEAYHDAQNAKNVRTIRLEAESKDGTLVPMTVFHKPCDGLRKKPLLVHVYGAYGIDLSMTFKPEKLLLIEDDWILAYCHVRGGGELGHRWHEEGRLENKCNGLEDLKACITQLHALGYSEPSITALTAASAGGVLAGALCNAYPDLTRAIILQAPFLDVLNTMLNARLPLTIEEQEEWGNPLTSEKSMEYIKSYCPYQNIKPQNYPSVLIQAIENDQRIPLLGLLRYVSCLRKAVEDYSSRSDKEGSWAANIILHIQSGGSHCNSSSWEDSLNEVAEQYAFLYKELGLDVVETLK